MEHLMAQKKWIIIIGVVILVILIGSRVVAPQAAKQTPQQQQAVAATPLAKTTVDKQIKIALGKTADVKALSYTVESAEVLQEIVVKGQVAKAAPGRAFLVLNLKITNDTKQGVQLNTRDFVRIAMKDKENEWIAPDIHNDPVEVQALATKYTRIGFPIDENARDMKLSLGEIDKEKTVVDIKL